MANYAERVVKFNQLVKEKPNPGRILRSKDGRSVPVYVEVDPVSSKRVVYTNALIDDECTDWYLSESIRGLKVLILPKSQEALIQRNGGSIENLKVDALRVVRHNKKGTALIAEVLERNGK